MKALTSYNGITTWLQTTSFPAPTWQRKWPSYLLNWITRSLWWGLEGLRGSPENTKHFAARAERSLQLSWSLRSTGCSVPHRKLKFGVELFGSDPTTIKVNGKTLVHANGCIWMFMKNSSRRKLVVLYQPSAGAQKDLPLSQSKDGYLPSWFSSIVIFDFLVASNCKTTPLFWYFCDCWCFFLY